LVDKQQNIDTQSVEASSSEPTVAPYQSHPAAPPSAARLTTAATAVRRRDLKPSLMSHISGVHRLSGGLDCGESAASLPKYGVECPDRALLDEAIIMRHIGYYYNAPTLHACGGKIIVSFMAG